MQQRTRHWVWLAGVGLFVALAHLPYLFPGGPWARLLEPLRLGQDEGTVLYDSARILHGQVMYKDFFEFQGPVFYYLHALLFWITGPSILAARIVHIVVTAVGATLIANLVARFAGRIAGTGAAAIHAFILLPMWPFAYPHWLAEAMVLVGLTLLARDQTSPRDEILAGACFGLALMTIQSVGLPVLVATSAACAYPFTRASLVRPLRVLGGGAAAIAPIAIYFAAHGALGDLYYAMFRWSLTHYKLGQGPAVTYAWFVADAKKIHGALPFPWSTLAIAGLDVTYVLPIFAIVSAVVLGALALLRKAKPGALVAAAAGVAGVSPLWLAPIRPDLTHVAYLGSFGLVAIGLLVGQIPSRRWIAGVAVCVVGVMMFGTYLQKTSLTWKASRKMGSWRQESLKLPSAAQLNKITSKDSTIVVGAMGGFYYLYVRPSAVPNTYIPATFAQYLSEEQWVKIADGIATHKPEAMLFVGRQWTEIVKRRPELQTMYHPEGGLFRLTAPAKINP